MKRLITLIAIIIITGCSSDQTDQLAANILNSTEWVITGEQMYEIDSLIFTSDSTFRTYKDTYHDVFYGTYTIQYGSDTIVITQINSEYTDAKWFLQLNDSIMEYQKVEIGGKAFPDSIIKTFGPWRVIK